MAKYLTILTLSDGTEVVYEWDAEDAMHAVEQLLDDPSLYTELVVVHFRTERA